MPAGTYTVDGKYSGTVAVVIKAEAGTTTLSSVSVTYHRYSDISGDIINGTESVSVSGGLFGLVTFHEQLTLSGRDTGSKVTSEPGGYSVSAIAVATGAYQPTGTMTTTLNGHAYTQPVSYK